MPSSALVIQLNASENQVTVNGRELRLTRRHEAQLFELLLRAGATGLRADALNVALAHLGQPKPLNRAQISRLLDSLEAGFSAADAGQEFADRFFCAQRARTVGPWYWRRKMHDQWTQTPQSFTASALVPRPTLDSIDMVQAMPRLFRARNQPLENTPEATPPGAERRAVVPIANHEVMLDMVNIEVALWEGENDLALRYLQALEIRPGLHTVVQSWNQLRQFDVLLVTRDRVGAQTRLERAAQLLAQDVTSQWHHSATLALARVHLDYAQDRNAQAQNTRESCSDFLVKLLSGHLPNHDQRLFAQACKIQALALRRCLEADDANRADLTGDSFVWNESAMLSAVFTRNFAELQNILANQAYHLQRGIEKCWYRGDEVRKEVFAWYSLSQRVYSRMGLPDDSAWDYVFIGDFWLYDRVNRSLFERCNSATWQGKRPDRAEFYLHAMTLAARLGDPRQRAHAALNAWQFYREEGMAREAESALVEWNDIVGRYPDELELIVRDGYEVPPGKDTNQTTF